MNEIQKEDSSRNNAINLFKYIKELTRLRNPTIRNCEKYESTLWFSSIPKENECYTPAWGATREDEEDIWLEIKKPPVKPYPNLPENLNLWVSQADLMISSNIPEIRPRIPIIDDAPKSLSPINDLEMKYRLLKDNPEILSSWKKYLDNQWKPWAEYNERIKPIQKIYSILHSMYLQQKQLGETYEVILGIGLLSWASPDNILRHLITFKATIEFDGKSGNLIVKPASDGIKASLEQDMLEINERPNIDYIKSIEEKINGIGNIFEDTELVKELLKSWVHYISSEGKYIDELNRPSSILKTPTVSFSPALILRKRDERSLLKTFDDIITQLQAGVPIPFGVKRIVELIDDTNITNKGDDSNPPTIELKDDFDVLFPLPSNDEQRKIIETIKVKQGVLVQGPPGTGKSHTIVNLICHLLAMGKRILVTSQTPRALNVLKGMMPKDLSSLCVGLLGNNSFTLKELEDSVYGITSKQYDWDPSKNKMNIKVLKKNLQFLRKSEAEKFQQLRKLRERECDSHQIIEGKYNGSAQSIGKTLLDESKELGWLEDEVNSVSNAPINNDDAIEFLNLNRKFKDNHIEELKQEIVSPDLLPSVEDFINSKRIETECISAIRNYSKLIASENYLILKENNELNNTLKKQFLKILELRNKILKYRYPWVLKAVNDILSDEERIWKELLFQSKKYLDGLLEITRKIDESDIALAENAPKNKLVILNHAKNLLSYFQNGKKIGLFFNPKSVKDAWYLIKKSYFDGKLCDCSEILEKLILCLDSEQKIIKLTELWRPYFINENSSMNKSQQVCIFEDFCEPLEKLIDLHTILNEAKETCQKIANFSPPAWESEKEIENCIQLIDGVEINLKLSKIQDFFKTAEKILTVCLLKPNFHPIINRLINAIKTRDEKAYSHAYLKLIEIYKDVLSFNKKEKLHDTIFPLIPETTKKITKQFQNNEWDQKLSCFVEGWNWKQAKLWLSNYVEKINESDLLSELKEIQEKINDLTSKLASEMAWGFCFTRLKETERQHLEAWTHEMKKIGKSKSKRAEKHRKAAMEHMQVCRGAIPAWIMPLYKVAETIKMGVDLYDVVIIDEASQSGPDALFLQFLAKQIIVVGDDQQISPDNIGIVHEDVDALQQQFLKDLPSPHVSALGVGSSFFNLAKILFEGKIVLREHFRCVPEIIEFSNRLCYSATPLKPLRQYPPNRLEPVVSFHVKDGFREGASQRARNLPEAQAIADKIAECCINPRYNCTKTKSRPYGKKTIGVISLLGEYQAKLIEKLLLEKIGAVEMEERNIICGNPYHFQGDERDVIFLSMVASSGENDDFILKALVSEQDKRRFNVAASRARDQLWLFHTPTENDFRNHDCLRFRLLNYCLNPKLQEIKASREKCESQFEKDLYDRVVSKGYRIIPQFEVSGYFIDFVIEGDHKRLAVECDGDFWHSEPEQRDKDMHRQRVLERCGWIFWRIRGSEFYFNPEQGLESLWETLESLGIYPETQTWTTPDSQNELQSDSEDNTDDEELLQDQNESEIEESDGKENLSTDIDKEKTVSLDEIQESIIKVLESCPNNSCPKDSITIRVICLLKLAIKGTRQLNFSKQVYRALNRLKGSGIIEEYKTTNIRVRLINVSSLREKTKKIIDEEKSGQILNFKEIKKDAEEGNIEAQYILGKMYYNEDGIPQDYQEAFKWYKLAAERGHSNAQFFLAYMHRKGKGVPQNYQEAMKWYKLAAEQGNFNAQYNIGNMYRKGEGIPQDYQEAMKWYMLAAEQDCDYAQYNIGQMYYNGEGVSKDYYEAFKWCKLAAEQGCDYAQYNVGLMYYNGEGISEDYKEALKWFKLAAEQGDSDAQYYLGKMYRKGEGVSQDFQEAMKWFKLAAEQDDSDAQYTLGKMYRKGEGISQNFQEAMKWFKLAAKNGKANAQYSLGLMYYNGEGVLQDYQEAMAWYKLAAEQQNSYAQCELGYLFQNCKYEYHDNISAYIWFSISAKNGNKKARTVKEDLEKTMPLTDLTNAQQKIKEWFERHLK